MNAKKYDEILKASSPQDASSGRHGCLQDKVAVITGAARGIGRATAVAFARQGAELIGIDICAAVYPPSGVTPARKEDLDETGRLVQAEGRRWLGLILDQRDLPALREVAQVEREFGGTKMKSISRFMLSLAIRQPA